MKKLLSALMATAIAASSTASVVACGSEKRFNEIWLVTDTGKINDRSFNQSSFEGGNIFLNDIIGNKDDAGKAVYSSIAYSEPKDLASLPSAYNNAAKKGAKTLILPGFHHAVEEEQKAPESMKEVDGSTILLDSSGNGIANQIGVQFRGDISGFYGGLSAIVYEASKKTTEGAEVGLGTFGGVSNPASVDNFMVGYLAAVNYWNGLDDATQAGLVGKTTEQYKKVNAKVIASDEQWSENTVIKTSSKAWFSGSFLAGSGSTLSKTLLQKKADVIMPVAGPQTLDTLNAIKSDRPTAKVVGVDSDQVLAYPEYEEFFITSAQKDLVATSVVALGHVKQYKDDAAVQTKVEEWWKNNGIKLTIGEDVLDAAAQKGQSWEGKDIFAGGSMGTNAKNLIVKDGLYGTDKELTKHLKGIEDKVIEASKALFAKMPNLAGDDTIISAANVKAYAEAILGTVTNPEE